jgi:hypothetical protein
MEKKCPIRDDPYPIYNIEVIITGGSDEAGRCLKAPTSRIQGHASMTWSKAAQEVCLWHIML